MRPAVLERKFEELESTRFQLQAKSGVLRVVGARPQHKKNEVRHMNPLTDDDDEEEANTVVATEEGFRTNFVDQSSIINLRRTWDRHLEMFDADHSGTLGKDAIKQILASMGAAPHRFFVHCPQCS